MRIPLLPVVVALLSVVAGCVDSATEEDGRVDDDPTTNAEEPGADTGNPDVNADGSANASGVDNVTHSGTSTFRAIGACSGDAPVVGAFCAGATRWDDGSFVLENRTENARLVATWSTDLLGPERWHVYVAKTGEDRVDGVQAATSPASIDLGTMQEGKYEVSMFPADPAAGMFEVTFEWTVTGTPAPDEAERPR